VRLRKRYLPLAALLGVCVAVVPTIANSATSSETVQAIEEPATEPYPGYPYPASFHWSPVETAVTTGGTVTFTNNSSTVEHGIVWTSAVQPTCKGTVPVGVGVFAANWSGSCTFSQAGTYTYYCSHHGASMHGTIFVNADGTVSTTTSTTTSASTTTTPTYTTTSTSTTTTTPGVATTTTQGPYSSGAAAPASTTPAGSSLEGTVGSSQGSPVAKLALAGSQRGGSVHGSVNISQTGIGGRLEVELLAKGASLAKAGHASGVRVGRLVRSSLRAGPVSFTIALSVKAKRAVKRHRKLALTVEIVLTPKHGTSSTTTRSVVVHA
jgi:plastocyanin